MSKSHLLELADAQIIGYSHGKSQDLIGMIISMGLTKDEWEKWKSDYTTNYLSQKEIAEVDHHFVQLQVELKDE